MVRINAAFFAAAFLIFAACPAVGALNAYLKMKGSKMALDNPGVPSGLYQALVENQNIVSPRDSASGLPTGKRQHKPITITKRVDKSSPLLAKALVSNEQIKELTLTFFQPAGPGKVRLTRRATLTGVQISSIKPVSKGPSASKDAMELETISFVFEEISWGAVSKTQGVDDWKTAG